MMSLEALLGAPMEVGRFQRLAIGMASALGELHQRGLVHKDIKPPNTLVNGATGEVRLTGFGIASRLPRELTVRRKFVGRPSSWPPNLSLRKVYGP